MLDPKTEDEKYELDKLIYRLAAIGANSSLSSYNDAHLKLNEAFYKLDLVTIVNMWDYLDDRVKVRVINVHSAKFKEWIESTSKRGI
jgi:hypothetical protein